MSEDLGRRLAEERNKEDAALRKMLDEKNRDFLGVKDGPASERQVGGNHYKKMAIQPDLFIYRNGIPYHEGNAIKYLCRWRDKGGLEDLRKAIHWIELLIERSQASGPGCDLPVDEFADLANSIIESVDEADELHAQIKADREKELPF